MKFIKIKGARQHNLKNINLELPRNKFIVITGLSGSGKSTLAFDTIYAEGQRRYVESLSAYARQFLGVMNKPDVDSIEGLSPAISIEQKTTSKNPRSTVGTITEIYDYLRLLFARIGTPHCPIHRTKIQPQTPEKITQKIMQDFNGKITILSPIIMQKKGEHGQTLKELNKEGYTKARVNNKIIRTDEEIKLEKYKKHNIEIVIDSVDVADKQRLSEAVENALIKSNGLLIALTDKKEKLYSKNMACKKCGIVFEELQPRMFSFNSPFGACESCHGLGIKMEFDSDLIIPNKSLSIMEGALEIYGKMDFSWRAQQLKAVGKEFGFDLYTPINKFTKKQLDVLLYGCEKKIKSTWDTGAQMHFEHGWEGVVHQSERLFKTTDSEYRKKQLGKFMRITPCITCDGKRLKQKILSVTINEKSIIDITDFSIRDAISFFNNLKLTDTEEKIARQILKEIRQRLNFLDKVGLSYLSLSRSSGTLSGGEAQRIRLATQIGSNLTGVLYILDEPSIGLHQRDNQKLINTLHKLRDLGNTLIVVEHDEDTILKADYVVDIGPRAGVHGGEVVAKGTPNEIKRKKESLTAQYLLGKRFIATPKIRREKNLPIVLQGCSENNLKNIDVEIPTQVLNVITGVSGSGKSTLVNEILYKAMMQKIYKSKIKSGKHKAIKTDAYIDKVLVIDQSPIGRTPRSNPATYTKVFDEVRKVFSETREAKIRGYKPGRFSFNVEGGRCEKCGGEGTIKIEMNFLPDVYIECEECKGKRFNSETLEVKYKGKSISDVLNMTVEEAVEFFQYIPLIRTKLETLNQVGLGYIRLGQSSITLSGGESQRIKLTKELSKKATGRTLYLLDEPTTGLHFHDIKKLINVLREIQ
jgi:excinuclease ABC subunit A